MTDERARTLRHPIGVAAARTGLTPSVIRVWERRYGAVEPDRSDGGHRLYSDAEIERLDLLNRLTQRGHRIGGVADLSTSELRDLLRQHPDARMEAGPEGGRDPTAPGGPPAAPSPREPAEVRVHALEAIHTFDAPALDALLRRAALSRSTGAFVEEILVPLMREVGEEWENGRLGPAEEHMASAVVTRISGWLLDNLDVSQGAPSMLVATPAGHVHALGALWAAVLAAAAGWRVTYLGPDLPAEEIAAAAHATGARVVALGLVYPREDEGVRAELRAVASRLPDGVTLIGGGAGVASYRDVLDGVGARTVDDYRALVDLLDEVAGAPT